ATRGAVIVTRARATGFVRDESGRVTEVTVAGPDGGLTLRARHTISAAGAGSDQLLELATGEPHNVLRPSKGVHLMVPRARVAMRDGLLMRTETSRLPTNPRAIDASPPAHSHPELT